MVDPTKEVEGRHVSPDSGRAFLPQSELRDYVQRTPRPAPAAPAASPPVRLLGRLNASAGSSRSAGSMSSNSSVGSRARASGGRFGGDCRVRQDAPDKLALGDDGEDTKSTLAPRALRHDRVERAQPPLLRRPYSATASSSR